MPSRLWCGIIIVFWLATTAWLIERDVVPSLGLGELTYDRALSARAVEEPVEWLIYRDTKNVGNLFFAVDPKGDGSFELQSRGSIKVALPTLKESDFHVESIIYVDPLKRLDRMSVSLSLPQSATEVRVQGETKENILALKIGLYLSGEEKLSRNVEFAIDRKTMMLDILGQLDRLPDLRPGKRWRTRFVNPVTALLTSTLSTASSLDYIQHEITGVETITWNDDSWPCYKVSHRYQQQAATASWARVSDGKVLVQEVLFGGVPFRLVAVPGPHDRKTTLNPDGSTP